MSKSSIFPALATIAVLAFIIIHSTGDGAPLRRTVIMMDTVVEITVYGPRRLTVPALDKAVKEMKRLAAVLDRHSASSEVAALNADAGKADVKISPELLSVVKESDRLFRITEGYFDPTVAPVLDAYGFGRGDFRVLTDRELEERLLPLVGWEKFSFDPDHSTARLRKHGMMLDFGGIAKGMIVDRALAILKKSGAPAAIVNAGGDLATFGRKPSGGLFRIGIQDPDNASSVIDVLEVADCAVATSGDYERFFEADGKRWHHLVNPHTGRPSRNARSVTIVAPCAMLADAWATSVFAAGARKGLRLAEEAGIPAMILLPDRTRKSTSAFTRYLPSAETGKK